MKNKLKIKAYKQMLWISMLSMSMMFAGLTSAYLVSRSREDWVAFDLPKAFYISTILILLSSIVFYFAQKAMQKNKIKQTSILLLIVLVLGVGFVVFQFEGFKELIKSGLYFTGAKSTISSSFLYVITFLHVLHVLVALIVLLVIIIKQLKNKYNAQNTLGINLGAIFWHFLDILWIYLFLFFYFIR